jgi:hypothetical protein
MIILVIFVFMLTVPFIAILMVLILRFIVLFIVFLNAFIPFFIVAVVLLLDNRSRCRFAPSHRLPSSATTLFDWLGLISLLRLVQIDRVHE